MRKEKREKNLAVEENHVTLSGSVLYQRGIINRVQLHPASRAISCGTYAVYREKTLHESCQVLVEHAQSVAKIQFRTQAIRPSCEV